MVERSSQTTMQPGSMSDPNAALISAVFESLTSSLVVFDRNLRIVSRNRAAELMLPPADGVADVLTRLTIEGSCVDWQSELRAIIQSPHSRHFDAMAPRGKDQTESYLSIVISPLRAGDSSEVLGGLMLADDVTARISMERRLAVSERMAAVGKLAARVAHELNNPLDGILRFTNLALRHTEPNKDTQLNRYLENVKGGIQRMAHILGTLLEFSRSTPGALEQATINQIVEDALAAMEGRIREGNVTVVCNFHHTDMPVVRGSSLFQVLCNLIKNAVDAMPEGGTLTLSTDLNAGDVFVLVEDTGIGLPIDVDRIFEPFFTTKMDGQGTGLGLAVCRELIERLGGSIGASRREPRGTVMTVRFPQRTAVVNQ
jgi:signal transduction histidine kinase